ncbi:hypothetical protein Taro_049986 [Colocasia esculenta]|uniref:Uncharacterized protein n=1 Tax=Colocasia esculenta TaxID=4460 RepID=A0A843XCN1_COLES|nr:hypothetical protein [Colocasia esculenta]
MGLARGNLAKRYEGTGSDWMDSWDLMRTLCSYRGRGQGDCYGHHPPTDRTPVRSAWVGFQRLPLISLRWRGWLAGGLRKGYNAVEL